MSLIDTHKAPVKQIGAYIKTDPDTLKAALEKQNRAKPSEKWDTSVMAGGWLLLGPKRLSNC